MDAMDYEFVEGRDDVNDEANTLYRDVQILRKCLERIVSYYDLAKTGSSLPSLTMQAKATHENTMFGEARKVLAKTANALGNRRDAGPIGGASVLTDEFDINSQEAK